MEIRHHYAIQVQSLQKSCHKVNLAKDKLAHQGIKGQKWGVRRGPPYPISQSVEGNKAKEVAPLLYDEAKQAIMDTVNARQIQVDLCCGPVTVFMEGHISDRFVERGLDASDVIEALDNPLTILDLKEDDKGRPSQKVIGLTATIPVNPETGKATSVWPTRKQDILRYGGEESD